MSKEENIMNAPWNMAQIYYIELAKLLRYKDIAYLSDDYKGYRQALRAVYRRIYFKTSQKEREEFKGYFEEINREMGLLRDGDNGNNKVIVNRILRKLDNMDMRIVEIMDKYKMIFPDVEIKSLENYEKKMGLI